MGSMKSYNIGMTVAILLVVDFWVWRLHLLEPKFRVTEKDGWFRVEQNFGLFGWDKAFLGYGQSNNFTNVSDAIQAMEKKRIAYLAEKAAEKKSESGWRRVAP